MRNGVMSEADTGENHRLKYLTTDAAYGRTAATTLRDAGYEVVLTSDLDPEGAAVVTVQEDVSHVLIPENYSREDRSAFIEALDAYGADDVSILAYVEDAQMDDVLDAYAEIPWEWQDVGGVGEELSQLLEDTDMAPWDIDEQELNRALVKAYGPETQRMLVGNIKKRNPHLFR